MKLLVVAVTPSRPPAVDLRRQRVVNDQEARGRRRASARASMLRNIGNSSAAEPPQARTKDLRDIRYEFNAHPSSEERARFYAQKGVEPDQ